jgi:cold shock CspA family protein
MRKFPETIRIVKFANNHYVSATSDSLQDTYVDCQNVVLSAIESALNNRPYKFYELNGGKLLNFELIRDKAAAIASQLSASREDSFNFKTFLFNNQPVPESNANDSLSQSEKQSAKEDSIGTEIVSLLFQRRKDNQHQKDNFSIGPEEYVSSGPKGQPSTTSQPEPAKQRGVVQINEKVLVGLSPNVPADRRPDLFENFSQKAVSTNTNLSKSIHFDNLEYIFHAANKNQDSNKTHLPQKSQFNKKQNQINIFQPKIVQQSKYADQHSKPLPHRLVSHHTNSSPLNELPAQQIDEGNYRFLGNPAQKFSNDFSENSLRQSKEFTQGRDHSKNSQLLSQPQQIYFDKIEESKAAYFNTNQRRCDLKPEDRHFPPTFDYPILTYNSNVRYQPQVFDADQSQKELAPISNTHLHQKPHQFPLTFNHPLSSSHPRQPNPTYPCQPAPDYPHHPNSHSQLAEKPKPSKKNKRHQFKERHGSQLFIGSLKFFDEKNGFGFITIQADDKPYDVFVYRVEFQRAKLDLDEIIRLVRSGTQVLFRFQIAFYCGKYEMSKKAINLTLLEDSLGPLPN